MIRCAYVFTTIYRHDTCLRVCVCGWGREGEGKGGVSCVCICHSRDRKIFLASKDENKVLKS